MSPAIIPTLHAVMEFSNGISETYSEEMSTICADYFRKLHYISKDDKLVYQPDSQPLRWPLSQRLIFSYFSGLEDYLSTRLPRVSYITTKLIDFFLYRKSIDFGHSRPEPTHCALS